MAKQTAPQMTDFTFADTGISVKIRKISPMLATDVAAAIPEPTPPEQAVDYGTGKGEEMEKNYSDPGYLAAKAEWQRKIYTAVQRVMLMRSVVPVDPDWRKDSDEYRSFIEKQTGVPLDETEDLVVYVTRICVGTSEDLTDLLNAITRRSQPTQEAVQAAKSSFRS